MKKHLIIKSLLALGLVASLKADSMTEMMVKLEQSTASTQKGFLYNSADMIKSSAKDMIKISDEYYSSKEKVEAMLPKGKKLLRNAAMISVAKMKNSAQELLLHIDDKNMRDAYESYSEILRSCHNCHKLIRQW
jgi:hypothetical protein